MDSSGNVVLNTTGETDGGTHEFTWDGKNTDGVQQEDGAYTLNVTPAGIDDEAVSYIIAIQARITGVNMETGTTLLEAGGVAIPLENVLSIKESTATTTADTTE